MFNFTAAFRTALSNPRYLAMRAVSRFDVIRSAVVGCQRLIRPSLARFLELQSGRRSKHFEGTDIDGIVAALAKDGFAPGLRLPPSTLESLLSYARNNPCWADRDPRNGFKVVDHAKAREALGRPILIAQYFNARQNSATIAELSTDPVLLAIAARYLGTPPRLVGTNLWWSFPERAVASERSRYAQMFHYDLDDVMFVKFFFYLTHVGPTDGPHVAVLGTHRSKVHHRWVDRLTVRRYSDEEVVATYGKERVLYITGPAGTGFAEDTICIHKGLPPETGRRLVLQIQYAVNDFGNQHDDVEVGALGMLDL